MDWWNDLTDWLSSDDGWRVLSARSSPSSPSSSPASSRRSSAAVRRSASWPCRSVRRGTQRSPASSRRRARRRPGFARARRAGLRGPPRRGRRHPDAVAPRRRRPARGELGAARDRRHQEELVDVQLPGGPVPRRVPRPDARVAGASQPGAQAVQERPRALGSSTRRTRTPNSSPGSRVERRPYGDEPPQDTPTASATTTGGTASAAGAAAGAETAAGGPATDEPSAGSTPGFSVSRGDQTHHDQSDQNATTPFGATGATTPVRCHDPVRATGATTPFGATAPRPRSRMPA